MLVTVRWETLAACLGEPLDVFFTEDSPTVAEQAKAVCRRCAVRDLCLDFALTTNQAHGVWGGMTAKERTKERRRRRDSRRVG